MVEISTEQSMLVTVVTFLSVFSILVGMMPVDLLAGASVREMKKVDVPEFFSAIDIQRYASVKYFNLTWQTDSEDLTVGGWDIRVIWSPAVWYTREHIAIKRKESWWIFSWVVEDAKFYSGNGMKVSEIRRVPYFTEHVDIECIDGQTLGECYDETSKIVTLKAVFTVTEFTVYFTFNMTEYSTPLEAWQNNALYCMIGVTFDNTNTRINAWNVVGALLFFQTPDVHPAINALIAIPIWVAIAYLVYILILKAIPFVGG